MDKIPFSSFLLGIALSVMCIMLGFLAERRKPANPQKIRALTFNLIYFLPASIIQSLLLPIAVAITTVGVNIAGGGIVALSDNGWRLIPSFAVYLLVMDFGEYIFHRAQHRFAFLWSMHALHHSDSELNISTTIRHYWLDHLLKSVTIYLIIGMSLKINSSIVALYVLAGFYNYFPHMNLKVGFGRWSFIVNTPQYHRLHHSSLAEHRDCNFAAIFPIFDLLFGTYRQPGPCEFPPTGLDSEESPINLGEALLWPFRHDFSRLFGSPISNIRN